MAEESKGGKGCKKKGRNKATCANYRSEAREHINKGRRLLRHIAANGPAKDAVLALRKHMKETSAIYKMDRYKAFSDELKNRIAQAA